MIKIKQPNLLIESVKTLLRENLPLVDEYKKNNQKFYRRFYINKKSGGIRKIESPDNQNLKELLNNIYRCFCKADILFSECVTGFLENRRCPYLYLFILDSRRKYAMKKEVLNGYLETSIRGHEAICHVLQLQMKLKEIC